MILSMLDLFSGIGGFSLAGQWSGFETIQFVEKDSFCRKVLNKNFPNIPVHEDIKTFNFKEKVNLITGGFPCQPFSIAGKQKGRKDERYLWNEFYRIIKEAKPNWIIIENVSAIVPMELDNIIIDLERESYETMQFVLPACAANAPHRRDRLWIVANSYGERFNLRGYHREERLLQDNANRYIEKIQSEWTQFKPIPWEAYSAKDWMQTNTGIVRNDDGVSTRVDRIKSLGNAIVPQVVYPIMKLIYQIEKDIYEPK